MIFFRSDEHFNHKNVIRLCNRPFPDLHSMHVALTENHNAMVGPNDLTFFLGDFAFANMKDIKTYLSHLNGRKILIQGNHDKGGDIGYVNAGFELVLQRAQIKIAGKLVNLSHYPYLHSPGEDKPEEPASYKTRYNHLKMADDGNWLLHGHVHGTWKISKKMINVGCDVWNFKPVSISQIESIIMTAEKASASLELPPKIG